MKRVTHYRIAKESFIDMFREKCFNPCLLITFRDRTGIHTHKISAGYSDEIHVYRENPATYVLSQNRRLGYFGLEVFESGNKIGNIFIEDHQVKDVLGKDGLAPYNTIKRMAAYIQ